MDFRKLTLEEVNAMHKRASELLEHEKTIYYEGMAFAIEIPGFTRDNGGN